MYGITKYLVGMQALSPKCPFLKRKEAFSQALLVKKSVFTLILKTNKCHDLRTQIQTEYLMRSISCLHLKHYLNLYFYV